MIFKVFLFICEKNKLIQVTYFKTQRLSDKGNIRIPDLLKLEEPSSLHVNFQ